MEGDPAPVERTGSKKHVVWDEDNLAENEKIQAEFANVSVPEPKTPYHGPSSPGTELEDDMRPLALGEEGSGSAAAAPKMTAFDFFMGSDSGAAGASPQRDAGARGRARSETGGVGLSGGKRTERSASEPRSMSSDGSGGRSSEKRQRFQAARRAHYNMREALRLGRQLTSASEDDTQGAAGASGGSGGSGGAGGADGADVEDEHMRDCGSSRLQEGQPNGLQKPAARNGSSRQQQPAPGEPQRGAGAAADGGGGESDESAGKED